MDFRPGQYIGVRAVIGGIEQRRNYSLSAAPNGKTYQISVKREPGGKMSNHLHDRVGEGDVLELLPPSGAFTLADTGRPVVFITGGVGITPALAMLPAALAAGREVHFIHAARHGGVHAFREHVDELAGRHPQLRRYYVYAEQLEGQPEPDAVGLIDRDMLAAMLPATRDVDAYFLGPQPFMRVVKRSLRELGVPENQTYYEFFGPAAELA
jgi:nitric oxide dioxygenase